MNAETAFFRVRTIIVKMRYYFALLLMTIVLAGCSPKTVYVPVTETHTSLDTDSLTHLVKQMMASRSSEKEKETVYVFDKTTYTVNDNGDTIGKDRDRVTDRNHERQGERYLLIKELDSLRAAKNRVDTIYQEKPYPVEKTV